MTTWQRCADYVAGELVHAGTSWWMLNLPYGWLFGEGVCLGSVDIQPRGKGKDQRKS